MTTKLYKDNKVIRAENKATIDRYRALGYLTKKELDNKCKTKDVLKELEEDLKNTKLELQSAKEKIIELEAKLNTDSNV